MAPGEANAFEYDWRYRARPEQLPPAGSWRVWLLMAGRGFGKTRCGAEWVRAEVKAGRRRIALVGPTAADARDVMVEGEAGILAISPDHERPLYEPSKRRLTWRNGAVATTFSADEPERLRGPQHDAAWCDELGAWRYPEAWGHAYVRHAAGGRPAYRGNDDATAREIDPRSGARPDLRRDPRLELRKSRQPRRRVP